MLQAHGKYLADNAGAKMLIQGNCDERGSREYNLALGQRRAEARQAHAGAAGRARSPDRAGEPGRGKAALRGTDRSVLGRRTGAATCSTAGSSDRCRSNAWSPSCCMALAAGGAHAGLFDDDEARRQISDLQAEVAASQAAAQKALDERIGRLDAAFKERAVDLAQLIDGLRQDMTKLRGQIEVLAQPVRDPGAPTEGPVRRPGHAAAQARAVEIQREGQAAPRARGAEGKAGLRGGAQPVQGRQLPGLRSPRFRPSW